MRKIIFLNLFFALSFLSFPQPAKKTAVTEKQKAVVNQKFEEAEELFRMNKPAEAIPLFESIINDDTVNPLIWVYLGVSYYQTGEYEKSIEICVKGLSNPDTEHKVLAYNAGNSAYLMRNYAKADDFYATAMKEDSSYAPPVLNRANAQLKQDNIEGAKENYELYLSLNPSTPQRENIELMIQKLTREIQVREKLKPELLTADLNIANEDVEAPFEPEKVVEELLTEEKPVTIPKELVKDEAVAPKVTESPKQPVPVDEGTKISVEDKNAPLLAAEKEQENPVNEKVVSETVVRPEVQAEIEPEYVGSEAQAPSIPPEQLKLAEIVRKDGKNSEERVRIDEEISRFEEERLRLEAENKRLEEARKAAEEERLRIEAENRKKADEEAARIAEENRRKAAEEAARIAAEKQAVEEERRNLEKAKFEAELEAQRRAMEEERRKMEEDARLAEERRKIEEERKAFEAEQKRIIEENRRKAEEEARIKAEAEAKAKAQEEALRLADEKRKIEEAKKAFEAEQLRLAEENRRKREEDARLAEERRKIEEERKAFEAEQKRIIEENRRKAEEEARIKAEAEAKAKAEEEALRLADEKRKIEEAKKAFEAEQKRIAEENRRKAEEEARLAEERRKIEEERKAFEAEQKRIAEENRRKAEEEARIKAEAEAKAKAEEEARRTLEAKKAAEAELEAHRKAMEEERRKMEESKKAFEAEQKRIAEENRRKAEEEAKIKAEAEAKAKAQEEERKALEAKKAIEEEAKRQAEEKAKKAAEEARKAEIASWPAPASEILLTGGKNFTPDGDGHNDTVVFSPSIDYLEDSPESWSLDILDPQGNLFRSIKGKGELPKSIEWDGKSDTGEVVLSKNTYTAKLSVVPSAKDRSRTGKSSIVSTEKIYTGLLLQVIIPGHEWKMVVNSINFVPNAALDSDKLTKEQKAWNSETLDEIAAEIKAHPGAKVVIVEGYANNVSGTEKEDREELLPLSQVRADAIVEELVKRGVDRKLLQSTGLGGANPLAAHEDRANWYKNRRVEFKIKK